MAFTMYAERVSDLTGIVRQIQLAKLKNAHCAPQPFKVIGSILASKSRKIGKTIF